MDKDQEGEGSLYEGTDDNRFVFFSVPVRILDDESNFQRQINYGSNRIRILNTSFSSNT